MYLAPLEHDEHRQFLSKIGVKGVQLDNLLSAVNNSPSQIQEFLNTPLLLTLLAIVYQSDGAIPAELPEFFKTLFTTVFSKHDGTKPGFKRPRRTELTDRNIELLFESFSFAVMRLNYGVSFDEERFIKAFEDARKFRSENCTPEAFRHDLVKVACLLLQDGDRLAFAHKSLLEYFCASFIKHSTERQAEQIYGSIHTHQHWRPILQYSKYIDPYKYAKYFAIPNLKQTFDLLGIAPDNIHQQKVDGAFREIFSQCKALLFSNGKNEKWRLMGVSHHNLEKFTIYTEEQLFVPIITKALGMTRAGLTAIEFPSDFVEGNKNEFAEDMSGPLNRISTSWMNLLSCDGKEALHTILEQQLTELSKQYQQLVEYVTTEDSKGADFAIFNVI